MEPTGWLNQPIAQATLLAAAGALAYAFKDIPAQLMRWGRRFFISTLTVDSRDEFLFAALVEYMDQHPGLRGVKATLNKSVVPERHLHLISQCAISDQNHRNTAFLSSPQRPLGL